MGEAELQVLKYSRWKASEREVRIRRVSRSLVVSSSLLLVTVDRLGFAIRRHVNAWLTRPASRHSVQQKAAMEQAVAESLEAERRRTAASGRGLSPFNNTAPVVVGVEVIAAHGS